MFNVYEECDYFPEPEDFGYIAKENVPDLDSVRDHLRSAIEAIYKSGDVAKLDDAMDELASLLEVKIPKGEPLLTNKDTRNYLTWSLGYQTALKDISLGCENREYAQFAGV